MKNVELLSNEKEFDFLENKIIYDDMYNIYSENIDYNKLYGKTVLVSGSYGMLASYLIYFLIFLNEEKNFDLKIVSLSRGKEKLVKRFGKYVCRDYFKNYTVDINAPLEIPENIDFIIHAASLASPQHYEIRPIDVALPNTLGTHNLLELAVKNDVESFLFFSTCSIYGKTNSNEPITEDLLGIVDPLDIHSCYDESKRCGETLCKSYLVQKGVPAKIARIAHTYGPTMDVDNDPRVFASFVKNVIQGKSIEIKSEGLGKRAFCYLTDAVCAYLLILLEGRKGEAYNVINTDEYISIRELAEIVSKIGGVKAVFKERDKIEVYLEDKNSNESVHSNEKLKELGWSPKIDCKTGFERVILSMKEFNIKEKIKS